jgi:hypothetical protein
LTLPLPDLQLNKHILRFGSEQITTEGVMNTEKLPQLFDSKPSFFFEKEMKIMSQKIKDMGGWQENKRVFVD